MSESDERSSQDIACPNCPPGAPKPVVIVERFGVRRFFCPECEHVWEEPLARKTRL